MSARPAASRRRAAGTTRHASAGDRDARDPLPWAILAVALAAWLIGTGGELWRTSHWCHYVYLADAFNHGQLHLFRHPHDAGDMAIVDGRAFVVFGPLPAVVLMPLVALLGPGTPDVAVLVLTALFAVFAFHRLLVAVHAAQGPPGPPVPGRDGPRTTPLRVAIACTTLSFALGTPLHYGAPMGNVWLHAQVSALALQCWGLWMAATGRPLWSGVAFGLTVLTRPTAALAAPFAVWLIARARPRPPVLPHPAPQAAVAAATATPAGRLMRAVVAVGLPMLLAAASHAAYNQARFGAFTDAGYHHILMGEEFRSLVERYGRFHPRFLAHNLYGWFLRPPRLEGGALLPDPHGMSLLLSVPFLWLALVRRRVTPTERAALATALLVAIPALLYYNDGWVQFGQRFALDWIALALLACSFGAARAPVWIVVALTAAGVAVNAWGLWWFRANYLH